MRGAKALATQQSRTFLRLEDGLADADADADAPAPKEKKKERKRP